MSENICTHPVIYHENGLLTCHVCGAVIQDEAEAEAPEIPFTEPETAPEVEDEPEPEPEPKKTRKKAAK